MGRGGGSSVDGTVVVRWRYITKIDCSSRATRQRVTGKTVTTNRRLRTVTMSVRFDRRRLLFPCQGDPAPRTIVVFANNPVVQVAGRPVNKSVLERVPAITYLFRT